MTATLIPIYPLVATDDGWIPGSEMYFLDDWLIALHNEPQHECLYWKMTFGAGSALWCTSERRSRTAPSGVIVGGNVYLRYDGPMGQFVWRLTDESHEHLNTGKRAMKAVWPD